MSLPSRLRRRQRRLHPLVRIGSFRAMRTWSLRSDAKSQTSSLTWWAAQWPQLLGVLKRGGRYAVAGAIAGPVVALNLRTLYLKDLRLLGCTVLDSGIFTNLVGYIERGEIKPVVAKTYPLRDIVRAQQDFLSKALMGKIVLIP